MAKKYQDPVVKCPYYHWEEGKNLCCEGPDGMITESGTIIPFATYERRRNYEIRICKKNWKQCPYAQALTTKWEIW